MRFRLPVMLYLVLMGAAAYAQTRATLPADHRPGAAWVKLKPAYRNILSGSATGRTIPAIANLKARPLAQPRSMAKSAGRLGPRVQAVDIALFYELTFNPAQPVADAIDALAATGYFEMVEPVYTMHPTLTPNDPSLNQQYYLDLINAYEAWDVSPGSPAIVIAVVDTGGDLDHPDIQSQLYIDPAEPIDGVDNDNDGYIDNNRGWDFSGDQAALVGTPGYIGDNNPQITKGNMFSHGTMVAGCAAAATNNNTGMAGVGFNTRLMFTKHYSDDQPDNAQSYSSNLYMGVLYAAEHGARIINCSWGGTTYSAIAQQVIDYVTLDLGCLVVAAAGNSGVDGALFPASYNNVLSVAASDENDVHASFSNYHETVDISAPGTSIYTTIFNDGYGSDQGTSFSAPITAGAAGLVWALHPGYSPMQVAEQLRMSADVSLYDNNPTLLNKLGHGRLDVASALVYDGPSIRASNQLVTGPGGSSVQAGSNANLYFDFINYLAPTSSGLSVTLTSTSPYLTVVQGNLSLGSMATNTAIRNTATPFVVTVAANAPFDTPLEVLLTFKDGAYNDTQLTSFVLPSYIDVNENNITTTVTAGGRLGFSNTATQSGGSGFRFADNALLYEMGLIMGTSSSVLYNNVRGAAGTFDQDFTAGTEIKKQTPGARSYSEVTGGFRNDPVASNATLSVDYTSLVWQDDSLSNFVILEYKVKNTSANPVNGFYFGIFADWDVVAGGANDRASWHTASRLGYVFPAQATSNLPAVGIQVLSGAAKYYAIDNDQTLPGNPFGIYDAFTDAEKYQTISSAMTKTQAGMATNGNDVSHVVSSGPYNLAAGQQVTVAFALHAASNTTALIKSANYADTVYNYTLKATKPAVASLEVCYGTQATLHATGATKYRWYTDFVGGEPIYTGADFTTGKLYTDTMFYVSNASQRYESVRTPVAVTLRSNPVIKTSRSPVLCSGETVTLSVAAADEYTWSTGAKTQSIEVSTAGLYSVVVRDNTFNCTSPDVVTVTVKPKPAADFTITQNGRTTDLVPDQPIDFTAQPEANAEYYWEYGDDNVGHGASSEHTYDQLGQYAVTLTVTGSNLCQSTLQRDIDIVTSIESPLYSEVAVHPNPATIDRITVRHAKGEAMELLLYTAQGAALAPHYTEVEPGEYELDVTWLANGVYVLYAVTGGSQYYRKIVVAR